MIASNSRVDASLKDQVTYFIFLLKLPGKMKNYLWFYDS